MIDVRNWFLLNILRMDGQNSTKFCIHMIINKIYIEIYCKESFFGKCSIELRPLIDVRNWFLLHILRMDGQNLTKFCIHFIIDMIYVSFVNCHFCKFALELPPLIDIRNIFLLNILRMDGQNLTKICIHIIIDKIYVGKVKSHF